MRRNGSGVRIDYSDDDNNQLQTYQIPGLDAGNDTLTYSYRWNAIETVTMPQNYFREYNPHTGRYLQSDPLGQHSDEELYIYARANPLKYFDHFGLSSRYVGFPKGLEDELREAIEKAIELLSKCEACLCESTGIYAKYCITKEQRQETINALRTMILEYHPPSGSNCASRYGGDVVHVYPNSFSGKRCCLNETPNALASGMAHEALHIADGRLDHERHYYMEERCFGCMKFIR